MTINLVEFFQNTCEKYPDKIAVVDGNRALSFSELACEAFLISNELCSRQPLRNRPVALFLEKSADAVSVIFGVLMSGKCYCPLDVKSPPERLKKMLRTLQADIAVTTEKMMPKLVEAGVPSEQIINIDEISSPQYPVPWRTVAERVKPIIDCDPAYIIFTSGSTGDPKGVTISHRGVIDYIEWARDCYQVSEKEIIGNQAPLFFDNSTLDLFLMASTGGTLHLIPELCYQFPVKLIDYLMENRINFIFWVPSVLVNIANLKLLDEIDLFSLDKILFAGEVMPVRQLEYWREKVPHALFSNLYGPTEITVDCTYFHVPQDFSGSTLPIGRPCRNSDILILNDQNRPAGSNEIGELCVRGSSLALGYWNDQEKTRELFCQNPLHTLYDDMIYRTGDLVHRDGSDLIFFDGRKDNQIKHHGYRIELGEIETIVQGIAGVGRCSTFYENQEIHLVLELCSTDLPLVQAELERRLPRYMVPTRYHRVEKMPLTANGKTDRISLSKYIKNVGNKNENASGNFAEHSARS
jgi:D-alanine--poly(phosphoribitol) ligase subunit 1